MFMRLVPKLAEVMAALESSYKPFVNKVGSIIESAKLWYDDISGALIAEGFVQNAENRCMFTKDIDGVQCTICLYVDDLMLACTKLRVIEGVLAKIAEVTRTSPYTRAWPTRTWDGDLTSRCPRK